MVKHQSEIPGIIKKAFYLASTGRPGPVVIDLPKDMSHPDHKFPYEYPDSVSLRSYSPAVKGHAGQIKKAIQLLLAAKKPILYTGGGIIQGNASAQLTEFTHLLGAPLTSTLMGLGGFPAGDNQYVGMLGMHGTVEANKAMHDSDVILALGARFDDRVTNMPSKFCPDAKIIHVDIDPASISKTVHADVPIVGPVNIVLEEMIEQLKESIDKQDVVQDKSALAAWWSQIDQWRGDYGMWIKPRYEDDSGLIKPQHVIEVLDKLTGGEAFVATDVGQHQMFAAQYYKFNKPRRWINSGGLGTMGFGLPAAMGVKLAFPDDDVCCVTGEGSIQMNIQELSTCSQYNVPVKIFNLNNGYLGMVKQWQDMQYDSRYASSVYEESLPDFVKLVEAYGHVGMKVEKLADLEPAMKEALAMKDRLVFMDIYVDRHEHVYPMQIPTAGAMKDMYLNKSEKV
jgi:acetolactate synthase-1/2/3 large subunit